MFCRKCGKQILDDSEFCPVCGEKTAPVEAAAYEAGKEKPANT